MVIDTLENIGKYASLNALFPQVIEFLTTHNLNELACGRMELKGKDLSVIIQQTSPKTTTQARLESHVRMIDIQIPLTSEEVMGYSPLSALPAGEYNDEKDITFHDGTPQTYLHVRPGMFVIFFPEDGHAPGISGTGLRKIIVKVLA